MVRNKTNKTCQILNNITNNVIKVTCYVTVCVGFLFIVAGTEANFSMNRVKHKMDAIDNTLKGIALVKNFLKVF